MLVARFQPYNFAWAVRSQLGNKHEFIRKPFNLDAYGRLTATMLGPLAHERLTDIYDPPPEGVKTIR